MRTPYPPRSPVPLFLLGIECGPPYSLILFQQYVINYRSFSHERHSPTSIRMEPPSFRLRSRVGRFFPHSQLQDKSVSLGMSIMGFPSCNTGTGCVPSSQSSCHVHRFNQGVLLGMVPQKGAWFLPLWTFLFVSAGPNREERARLSIPGIPIIQLNRPLSIDIFLPVSSWDSVIISNLYMPSQHP